MNKLTLLAVGLAVLVLGTGAAAAQSADAPVDVPHPEPPVEGPAVGDEPSEMNETPGDERPQMDQDDSNMSEEDHAGQAEQGPPTDMPGPVPDHVTQIHEMIRSFIDGDLDGSLGENIQDVVGQEAADTGAQNGSESDA